MRRPQPGSTVILSGPGRLRGVHAVVTRAVGTRWEVEFRTALGTPIHLVVPAHRLRAPS